jgi:hypothetical protein
MKRKMITRDCAECSNKFRSMDESRTLCKVCEAEAHARLNAAFAALAVQRKADNARTAMDRRVRFAAARVDMRIDIEDLLEP